MTWIKDKTGKNGELPAIPQRLNQLFNIILDGTDGYRIEILTPSGQQLGNLTPQDEEIMTEICEWDGRESWEDKKHRTRQMLPSGMVR